MKRIKIQGFDKPDKTSVYTKKHYYNVYLGGSRWFYFKNEVKAKRFIAETNRFYNAVLHENNQMYMQLFCVYRSVWFFTHDNLTNGIQSKINDIEKLFDYTILKSNHFINGNPLTFQYLNKISVLLRDMAISLRSVIFEKDYFHELQKIDIYINQISELNKKLNSWGKNFPGVVLNVV
jgi:hypothetical protein